MSLKNETMRKKEVETKLLRGDFFACIRCKNLGNYGTDVAMQYCKEEFSNPLKESPEHIPYNMYVLGCEKFEWNGMSIHRKAYEIIMSDENFKKVF